MKKFLQQQLQWFFHAADVSRDEWVAHHARSLPANSRVLDIGAGPCRYRSLFANCDYKTQDFCQYRGVKTGPMADANYWAYGEIDFICDASAIPVPAGSFDVILCTEVLEHVPDPCQVVKEIGRITRSGGLCLITAPLGSGLHMEPYHYYGGFTPHWYRKFLAEAGFKDIRIDANGGFFRHYGQESHRFSTLLNLYRSTSHMGRKLAVTALWFVSFPFFRFLIPLLAWHLDKLDTHQGFTVGYHVSAIRE